MPRLDLESLRKDLAQGQARWTARDTWVARLDDTTRAKMLGVVVDRADLETRMKPSAGASPVSNSQLPRHVDWRQRNGRDHVTTVKDQGRCGSSVSFATVATIESMISIEHAQEKHLSEAELHFCSSHGANCGGWWPTSALEQARRRGIVEEAAFPYRTAFDSNGDPSCTPVPARDERTVSFDSFTSLSSNSDRKSWLAERGPLIACFDVYEDFFSYSGGVYEHVAGDLAGGHCVQVVGYDDDDDCWICKNSWGAGWGDSGFFRMAYGQCKLEDKPMWGVEGTSLPGGVGEFYTTDGSGKVARLLKHTSWRRTWQLIIPGDFGGDEHTDLLFYDPHTRTGEFYTTDGSGQLQLLRRHTSWRRTWTQIIPGNFGGNGHTDLLFYDGVRGQGEFYTTDGSGGMTRLRGHSGWRRTWAQIVPGHFGGSEHTDLLFYDRSRGEAEFYLTDGRGNMQGVAKHRGWRRTWTQIVPGDFGGDGHTDLLLYDRGRGEAEFYLTRGNGEMARLRSHRGWRRSWDMIIPGDFGGSKYTDLLLYDRSTGEGAFYVTDGFGSMHSQADHRGWRKTWAAIVPGQFGRSTPTDLLFYDPKTG